MLDFMTICGLGGLIIDIIRSKQGAEKGDYQFW